MKYLLQGAESARLKFRHIHESDYDEWLEYHKDPISKKYWNADYQTPEIECSKWYEKQFARYQNNLGGMNALIEKESNNFIGHCGLQMLTVDGKQEMELGYNLLASFRGKGYATEAAIKCRDFSFDNKFVDRLISVISFTNIPSQKVAEKIGMKNARRSVYFGNDVFIFQMTRQDWLSLKG